MSNNVTGAIVRRARKDDVSRLGELGALLVREHYEFDAQRFIPATGETARHYGAFLASQVEGADAVILVAEISSRVVGYAYAALQGYDYMALRGPAAVLQDLLVDPEYRGRGIGSTLLAAISRNDGTRRAADRSFDRGEERIRAAPLCANRISTNHGGDDARDRLGASLFRFSRDILVLSLADR